MKQTTLSKFKVKRANSGTDSPHDSEYQQDSESSETETIWSRVQDRKGMRSKANKVFSFKDDMQAHKHRR